MLKDGSALPFIRVCLINYVTIPHPRRLGKLQISRMVAEDLQKEPDALSCVPPQPHALINEEA
jgi:hypothetical protein